uniref:Uncharacterized protein n=1 Tax=Amphimedon queenslandica TaxID=400682 RepID=A0A1X7VWX5_AMPQE
MAEGRGTLTAKGHGYQQIYDAGDSSDSSSCLTRHSYSPFSKTPVRNIMSPNENLLSSSHEIREEELQPEDNVHVPAPALRSGIVRLEENEEYPIKRHCFRDCTKTIFRNRKLQQRKKRVKYFFTLGKKCAIVPFILAFIFMVIFIVCILRITEMYWYYYFGDGDNNTLFIPVGSVVDVNLTSLNISTKHINKLKVTVPDKSSPVRVTTAQEEHQISLPLNMDITLNYENSRCKSLLRYWKSRHSREHVTGDITIFEGQVNISYKWGNITNLPDENCNDHSSETITSTFDISKCFDDNDQGNDKNIICIQLCLSEGATKAIVGVNITETYAIPNKTSYKSIYNDDTDNQNSVVLQLPSLLSELHNPSKLYINTHYKNTIDSYNELNQTIKLELEPQSKENAMEVIETVALVITAILSLLLSLMMFGIGIRCCCCHIKTGFCALGLFYEE